MTAEKRHRHRKTWLVAGGYCEWCYECGAIRSMRKVVGTSNEVAPASGWTKPSGIGGVNPALMKGYQP